MALVCLALLPGLALAQKSDTDSIDSIINALYDVISGPAGQKRDWGRFHRLFAPGARMIVTAKRDEKIVSTALTPEDYEKRGGPILEKDGFEEKELSRRVESYGAVAHVFSTYDSQIGGKPYDRGINSIQLTFDGERWWIQSLAWSGEQNFGPIPEKYLGG
ncbi:MAG: hypothetical protein KIT11_02290 [Fimbriimonadaceae bacterium]|nr:hypothetical protein [Fimbriimonadaceae bacterium]QYK54802.1 MAG: hypothetical protein KF733_07245 [Fimbriimonadaceae bacterium]